MSIYNNTYFSFMRWKWSNGSYSEKTVRDKEINKQMRIRHESLHNNLKAQSIALNHDETTWGLMTDIQMLDTRKTTKSQYISK